MLDVKSMGIAELQSLYEIASEELASRVENGLSFNSPEASAAYLEKQVGGLGREGFGILLLNQQNQMIHFEIVFKGTINQASVYPRELVKLALQHNAAAAIITHNHPSGNPKPSGSDLSITKRIKEVLGLIDVRLLDHIIIGDPGRWHSMAKCKEM